MREGLQRAGINGPQCSSKDTGFRILIAVSAFCGPKYCCLSQ